jgi:thioester reductase-like protein
MRKVFLTGATGFLGGELAVALSKASSIEKIVCLVRAKNNEEATNRLRSVFALHQDPFDPNKVVALAGDLMDERLPMILTRHPLVDGVDTVVHAAANTSFLSQKDPIVVQTNLWGSQRIAAWASCLRSLETFAYVGTATIVGAGNDVVGRTVNEDEAPNPLAKHLVGYTRSKMFAEIAVRGIIPHDQLLVIRPSILVGDARSVVPRSFDIAWIITALKHLRMSFGNPDAACDVIPVDYAANAILELLKSRTRTHSTYHVSAGPAATTCRQVFDSVGCNGSDKPPLAYLNRTHLELIKKWLRQDAAPDPDLSPYAEHLEYVKDGIGKRKTRLMLAGLETYWRFIDLDQKFDNARLLADTQIGMSEPAHHYLKRTSVYLDHIDPLAAAVNP